MEEGKEDKMPQTEPNRQVLEFNWLVKLFEQTQTAMQARAARSVDISLVIRNWLFGWYIVDYQQNGSDRAEYGKQLLKKLSAKIKIKGCSERNLASFSKFYRCYSGILQAVPAKSLNQDAVTQEMDHSVTVESCFKLNKPETLQAATAKLANRFVLGWTHYVALLMVKNAEERRFYEIEATQNSWGYRELERQINSALYERLVLSRDKQGVKELSAKGQIVQRPSDIIKNPYILEFTGLEEYPKYSEHNLETALINKIEHFLLELGKGFLFESRQKRFTFDSRHFYVDLVFYNRLLRSYVLIDLKVGDLKHQDLGQMQMYVNYFDRYVKTEEESPTVGILLCHDKSDDLVELTLPINSNIYASKYQLYLPSKEELLKQLEEAQQDWKAQYEK